MRRRSRGKGGRVTTKAPTALRTWYGRRLSPDQRLGPRLTLASLAAFLLAVPFTALLARSR